MILFTSDIHLNHAAAIRMRKSLFPSKEGEVL